MALKTARRRAAKEAAWRKAREKHLRVVIAPNGIEVIKNHPITAIIFNHDKSLNKD